MSRLYPCAYCTEDGYCKKYSDEEVTSWCVQGPCKDERPARADKIRAMTDEEMASFLSCIDTSWKPAYSRKDRDEWLDWLKQEATDGKTD